ncbi:hypothetical protein ZIOFF_061444 [Zingiber officinale]|uniref:40S ribosomal protein S16 n=2 Tax=Zingiber officinale TaxID=94328 RepID=A0A8J5EZ49_ZINOF|nr:hypothetical protein ZIOFF_061444 [Zingiber officinale]
MASTATESVQCFGRKKTAVAVAHCKRGRGLIKVNGVPIELVKPEILRLKAFEPILLLGRQRFVGVDIRIRVKGGGKTSQIYAIRQSIAKALVAYNQKYVDEQSKQEIKDILVRYDRTLLVADPRRCEPKKFGGRGARARFQKSYRGGDALRVYSVQQQGSFISGEPYHFLAQYKEVSCSRGPRICIILEEDARRHLADIEKIVANQLIHNILELKLIHDIKEADFSIRSEHPKGLYFKDALPSVSAVKTFEFTWTEPRGAVQMKKNLALAVKTIGCVVKLVKGTHTASRYKFYFEKYKSGPKVYQTESLVVIRRPGNDEWIAKEQVLTCEAVKNITKEVLENKPLTKRQLEDLILKITELVQESRVAVLVLNNYLDAAQGSSEAQKRGINIQVSILARGYENWRNGEANLLVTRGLVGRLSNTPNVGFAYEIQNVVDYLASHGVRALPGRSYNTRDVLGQNWVIRQSTVNLPMQPTEVNTRNMLDGSVSLQFNQYQAATTSSPPKFNLKDEEIQSDEEELTSHTIAVLVEEERYSPELPVKRISSLAQLPIRRTPGAAGYDISITHAQDIPALGRNALLSLS